jgi:hypothetical protein
MTKEQILEEIRDQLIKGGDWEVKLNNKELEQMEQVGGEDQGTEYYVVWKIPGETRDMFVRASAHYTSYDGTDWSEAQIEFVEPYQKSITAWKTAKEAYNDEFQQVVNE